MMHQSLKKLLILITVILMDFLAGAELDIITPSFPTLQDELGLSVSMITALLSINFSGFCISLFLVGALSDRYGRKPIILAGLTTFVVGSLLCLFAVSYHALLLGRLCQGMGVAAPAILSFLIVTDLYPLKEQHFLIAMLNGAMNLAMGAAPVIGSYLTLYFNWQGNFSLLLMLGVITLLMTILIVPSYTLPKHEENISLQGMRGYSNILKSKPLILLMTTMLFIFVPYWIFAGMSSLLYINELGVSLTYFGYYQGSLAFVFALGSILYGFILKYIDADQKQMLRLTLYILLIALAMICYATLTNNKSALFITLAMVVFVIGQIIPSVILYPMCLNYIPEAKGKVSAVFRGSMLIASAVGLQIAGYFYAGSFQSIGWVIIPFAVMGLITLHRVMKVPALVEKL